MGYEEIVTGGVLLEGNHIDAQVVDHEEQSGEQETELLTDQPKLLNRMVKHHSYKRQYVREYVKLHSFFFAVHVFYCRFFFFVLGIEDV